MEFDEVLIDKVCRTCLSTTCENLKSLFVDDNTGEENFLEILNFTFGKMIMLSDALPFKICLTCQESVKSSYEFKMKITDTNSILKASDIPKTSAQTLIEYDDSLKTETIEVNMNFDDEMGALNEEIFDNESQNPFVETAETTENEKPNDDEVEVVFEEEEIPPDGVTIDPENLIEFETPVPVIKDGKHKCPTCGKGFDKKTYLKRHQLTHEEAKLKCDIEGCEKRYIRRDHLAVHKLNAHADYRAFTCPVENCRKRYHREDFLKKHMDSQHSSSSFKVVCDICSKTFKSKKYLNTHMKTHENQKQIVCKVCNAVFTDRALMTDHITKAHPDEKPYLCSECGLRFIRNDYLVVHMRRHLGIKPYKCKFCGKGFPRATDVNVHEKYHTNEKTHLCTTCGKGFQRAYNLHVHMRVHSGEKPYKCTFCTKSFSQGNDLKAHVRRHTGERFKCEICNEGFIQGYHLTQHKRTVHGLDVQSNIRRVQKFAAPSTSGDLDDIDEDEV